MIAGVGGNPRLAAGEELNGRYALMSEIGRGGTGTVWRAADHVADREVAVKVLHQRLGHHQQLVSGFVRQRTTLTGVEHPHLVSIYDLVFNDGVVALVAELVEGQTVRQVLRRGLLPIADAVTIGNQVASALARLHLAGIVHCDVKPENILLATTPDHSVDARLADLGTASIAREMRGEGFGPGDAGSSGTPGYLPPEASGLDPPSPAADVYALGVMLYELATGRGPAMVNTRPGVRLRYDDSDVALPELLPHGKPAPTVPSQIPEVPRPLWRIVGACLRADPAARPTAARLVEDLAALSRNDTAPAVLPLNGAPLATGNAEFGWPATLVETDDVPTPVQDRREPEVAKTVAADVRSRWTVGPPAIVACVLAAVLVTAVGAGLQRSWSNIPRPSGTTSTMPAAHASARTSAERYFAPTGWICAASSAQTPAGGGSPGSGGRKDRLRLCLGIWDGTVRVSVRKADVAPTTAPVISSVSPAGASSHARSEGSSPPRRPVWPVKVELSSIVSESGATAMTKVFRCDLFQQTGRNRCDMEPVAARAGLTYRVAAYVLPPASPTPPAASFPKTPTVVSPLIQNGRSQDHGTPLEETNES
jgi:serine/threonine-protein kinase